MQMKRSLEKKRLLGIWADYLSQELDWLMAAFWLDPERISRTQVAINHVPSPLGPTCSENVASVSERD